MPAPVHTRTSVLIVEDSLAVGRRLAELLSEIEGVDVVGHAVDAREALNLFRHFQPEAVVLDLHLPDRSGLELIPAFRESRPSCTIIVLTNSNQPEFKARSLAAGAHFFLSKSQDFEQVAEILGKLEGDR